MSIVPWIMSETRAGSMSVRSPAAAASAAYSRATRCGSARPGRSGCAPAAGPRSASPTNSGRTRWNARLVQDAPRPTRPSWRCRVGRSPLIGERPRPLTSARARRSAPRGSDSGDRPSPGRPGAGRRPRSSSGRPARPRPGGPSPRRGLPDRRFRSEAGRRGAARAGAAGPHAGPGASRRGLDRARPTAERRGSS